MKIKLFCFLILISIFFQSVYSITEKPVKRVIVIGHTGAGKSTFSRYMSRSKAFKTGNGADSVTAAFQTIKLNYPNYDIYVTDTPGFTDPKAQNNWELLDKITKFIKDEKIDFVILVLNYSIREQNETYIMRWLKYTLPFEKHNSLIIVNHYRENQNVSDDEYLNNANNYEENDFVQQENNNHEQNNQKFIDFLNVTFNNTNIRKIRYNKNVRDTQNEFKQLSNEIQQVLLPSASIDHSNVFSLAEKINVEKKKNRDYCYSLYHTPLFEKYQSMVKDRQKQMLEAERKFEAFSDLISKIQNQLKQMKPEGVITTRSWLFKKKRHYFFTEQQIQQMNNLHQEISGAETSKVAERIIHVQLTNEISKLKQDCDDLKETIPQMKKFQDCLEVANEHISDMIKVRDFFLNINYNHKVQKEDL